MFSNFAYLSLLQGINYLLPLLTIPYLLKVLGTEYFGLLAFATSLIAYFNLLTDYGFNFSATREVSLRKQDPDFIANTYAQVLGLRIIFILAAFFVLLLLLYFVPRFESHRLLYLLTFGSVVGQALVPIWLFQGLERMQFITWINSVPKVAATVAIFILVRSPEHYLWVPFLNALAFLISGCMALWVVRYRLMIRLVAFNRKGMLFQFKQGWHVFFSTIAVSFYTISTTFLLGLLTNNATVGVYAAAEKLARVTAGLYSPLAQAFYPYINQKINASRAEGARILHRMAGQVGLGMGFLSILLFATAPWLSSFLFDQSTGDGVMILRILSALPLATSISNVFAIQGLYSFGKQKLVANILLVAGLIHFPLVYLAIQRWSGIGAASALIFTEILVALLVLFAYRLRVKTSLYPKN